jgi:hypothetical protein
MGCRGRDQGEIKRSSLLLSLKGIRNVRSAVVNRGQEAAGAAMVAVVVGKGRDAILL